MILPPVPFLLLVLVGARSMARRRGLGWTLLLMGVAGLSVAYHAKPAVREKANVAINSGGLDRLLDILR